MAQLCSSKHKHSPTDDVITHSPLALTPSLFSTVAADVALFRKARHRHSGEPPGVICAPAEQRNQRRPLLLPALFSSSQEGRPGVTTAASVVAAAQTWFPPARPNLRSRHWRVLLETGASPGCSTGHPLNFQERQGRRLSVHTTLFSPPSAWRPDIKRFLKEI